MTLEGPVEARNERGIKLDGDWLNVSKFNPVDLPPVGARVRAEVDSKSYLKSLELLDGAPDAPARSKTISRLAVLKAAANFAADRIDVKSADVLRIADAWLAWVERED